jgi:4-carboxymuconolactone decarboxylase
MARILALLTLVAAVTGAAAAERFPILQPDQMNADQKKLLEALLAGPRGGGNTSPEAVQKMLRGGPFNTWLRSPDLGSRLQSVGEYIRYRTSLPLRLNEFAILITAREWTSQYEWYAHYPLAMKAGLDAKVADELALGKRPSAMSDDEAAVYEFCIQLHRTHNVDDATFNRALALFGEQGVVDLVGVSGYYTAVSMTLNIAQVLPPEGAPLPFK